MITADAMQAQNALADEMNQGLSYRVAALVDSDLAFCFSRMYELLYDQSTAKVKVCRDEQEAVAWVGCPIEVLDRS
jgi:glycerol-3-phosphate O-acyltransferase